MNRRMEKILGAKIKRYSAMNTEPSGLQSDESRRLVVDFMRYSLRNPIETISDIPKKYEAIAEA